jgi:hypothetical protein
MTRDEEVAMLDAKLAKAKVDISSWCARVAWPGRAPTPPFDAWEVRKATIARLAELGEKRHTRF